MHVSSPLYYPLTLCFMLWHSSEWTQAWCHWLSSRRLTRLTRLTRLKENSSDSGLTKIDVYVGMNEAVASDGLSPRLLDIGGLGPRMFL